MARKKKKGRGAARAAVTEPAELPPVGAPSLPAAPLTPAANIDDSTGPSRAPVRASKSADDEDDDLVIPKASRKPVLTSDVPRAREKPTTANGSFSFDLLPEAATVSTKDQLRLEAQVDTRRSMLEWHQALGITTAVLMAGTVIVGQLSYSDKFGGGGNTGQFEIWHSTIEAATVLSFAATGLLALLAPVPYQKHSSGVDTVTVHKYSMLIATVGMASEIPLGIYTVAREGYNDQAALAIAHLVIGYITAAALGTGATALFF